MNANNKRIEKISNNGKVISTYENMRIAAKENNISYSCISNCIAGRQNTAGGFSWKVSNQDKAIHKPRQKTNSKRVLSAVKSNDIGYKLNQSNRSIALGITDLTTDTRSKSGWRWMKLDKTTKQVSPKNIDINLKNGFKLC